MVFRRPSKPEEHSPSWITLVALLGWIFVALGVAGEGIAEGFVSKADGIVQTFNSILLTDAQKEAAFALERAANNESEAAQLRKDAEGLKADNLRLEAIISPRSLSLDQQKRIADACGKFSGHAVLVGSCGMDGEAAALGAQIISALQSVHIVVADNRGAKTVSGGFDIGVHVRGPQSEHEFISVLGNALSRIGKMKVAINDPEPRMGSMLIGGGQGFPAGTVFVAVMVGIKPLPLLSDAK